jgi:hypothetical protein
MGNEQTQRCSPYNRFRVKRLTKNAELFRISDDLIGVETTISKSLLENPKFSLGHWYAKQRTRALGLRNPAKSEYRPRLLNPIAFVTESLLRNGVHTHFPNVNPDSWTDDRFFVYLKDYGSTTYVIMDDDLGLIVEIELSVLENPKFNLIKWYLDYITENQKFRDGYIKQHKNAY